MSPGEDNPGTDNSGEGEDDPVEGPDEQNPDQELEQLVDRSRQSREWLQLILYCNILYSILENIIRSSFL